ncbi:MAG: PHP-associated domain-containing protein [Candidatus Nitrosotenuis sp.]|uniref:PHP domain protein n=1 Tax=Candidatus Nitrosotenuis uzonensis TaxID=1407055 RepID=A0A812F1G7_9ARCH|nr:PHP domain-containing protein [Candidatus Nitrosotenuis uzonensis]MCA2003320.1 PHP domain-containing protein [Candidatus Nitrosotenuis sp.]CAE6501324.1 PHP domain protein [Candidatus Nitrosotenuis uzonensis]
MDHIRAELHCHNLFSNFHVGEKEPPFDCNITITEQLERCRTLGLGAMFVTNHNTLNGYTQILEYKNDHVKYKDIQIYPAEEITTDTGAHVIAYGIHDEIPAGLPLEEIVDEIRRQDAISCAPHPFSLLDALREKAQMCDLIEVFNSNNVDVISNARATKFSMEHNKIGVAGSDSHVLSTLGRCVNLLEAENNLDDALYSMRHGKISILSTGYAREKETLEHIKYKINNSKDYLAEYIREHYPNSEWMLSLLLRIYDANQNSYLWSLVYKLAVFLMKRVSRKINLLDYDPSEIASRNLSRMLKMAI